MFTASNIDGSRKNLGGGLYCEGGEPMVLDCESVTRSPIEAVGIVAQPLQRRPCAIACSITTTGHMVVARTSLRASLGSRIGVFSQNWCGPSGTPPFLSPCRADIEPFVCGDNVVDVDDLHQGRPELGTMQWRAAGCAAANRAGLLGASAPRSMARQHRLRRVLREVHQGAD